jgi:glycine betaine/proline transport system ATP-binding protein
MISSWGWVAASHPRELSGGMQPAGRLARASVNPDIWFLDEPFSALDPLIRTITGWLLKLRRSQETIVFITHDFLGR